MQPGGGAGATISLPLGSASGPAKAIKANALHAQKPTNRRVEDFIGEAPFSRKAPTGSRVKVTDFLGDSAQPNQRPDSKAFGRRLRRMLAGASVSNKSDIAPSSSTIGMLAEYHVEQGIDDLELVSYLQHVGFEIVQHDRYVDTRSAWIGRLIRWLGDATAFKLILRKPVSPLKGHHS
jgi:hypothetical protein